MEEWVGSIWDRMIRRAAQRDHPEAAVHLQPHNSQLQTWSRALGRDATLRVETAPLRRFDGGRTWLERVAGTGTRGQYAWREGQTIYLPATLSMYPDRSLNRQLYDWLAALGAIDEIASSEQWLENNLRQSALLLKRCPGLRPTYDRLVEVELLRWQEEHRLPEKTRTKLAALLRQPSLPANFNGDTEIPPIHIPLWLFWSESTGGAGQNFDVEADSESGSQNVNTKEGDSTERRRAEQVEEHDGRSGLLAFRLESLFSWAEFIPIDRTADEADEDEAGKAVEDLDLLSINRSGQDQSNRIKLDLVADEQEDIGELLEADIRLPEWDHRSGSLRADYCAARIRTAMPSPDDTMSARLARDSRKLTRLLRTMLPQDVWIRNQLDGDELDIGACVDYQADVMHGRATGERGLYRKRIRQNRDMACLLIADLSMSTETALDGDQSTIDVIRDAVYLFSDALHDCGDRYGILGFSSRTRRRVDLTWIKRFAETQSDIIKRRIGGLMPGDYTRIGAAVRYGKQVLDEIDATHKLMLLLSDGKPNDMDVYEGVYGIEDTRMALIESRRSGISTFCVTVDSEAHDYLPYLFGSGGYTVVRRAQQLPQQLPMVYARLTHS